MPRKKAEPAPAVAADADAIYNISPSDFPAIKAAIERDPPPLADYIANHERDDIVLTRVSYPGATPHIHQSKFSGIEVVDGPLSCTYSDGSTE